MEEQFSFDFVSSANIFDTVSSNCLPSVKRFAFTRLYSARWHRLAYLMPLSSNKDTCSTKHREVNEEKQVVQCNEERGRLCEKD